MRKKASAKTATAPRPESTEVNMSGWLLLVFSLPTKRTSERVEVWRKLKRIGALPLGPPGYLLPQSAPNQEQVEWLAASIRSYKGQASVIQVRAIDDLPSEELVKRFNEARSHDYQEVIQQLGEIQRTKSASGPPIAKVRRRLQEITSIDFFNCALRSRAEDLLLNATGGREVKASSAVRKSEFRNKTWVTRPRPGIDRVSSAWLIKKFIDPEARFVFSEHAAEMPRAIPFDMFEGTGFSHRADHCTFETLCKEFEIRNPKVLVIAQIVHDADLRDEKYGRSEGEGLDAVLVGWAGQPMGDSVLLERGMELFEGLYCGMK
jgi:hypothetical protein